MTYTQLEYILALNKYRHFKRAAKACNISQPTLSMQISKLEEELDVIIFDRSKTPLIPTPTGEIIIRQAKVAVTEFLKITNLTAKYRDVVEGDFRLAVIPTLSPYLIPLFVEDFQKKYPKVNLTIEEYPAQEIIEALNNEDLDAGIIVTPVPHANLVERTLFYEPFHVFTSPDCPLGKKKYVREEDLDPDKIWILQDGHCFRNQTLKVCALKKASREGHKNIHFESGNLETLKNMVIKGSGFTILPHLAVADLADELRRFVRPFAPPTPTREVSLVHSRFFLKENIIVSLENCIIESIPSDLRSLKSKNLEVIEVDEPK